MALVQDAALERVAGQLAVAYASGCVDACTAAAVKQLFVSAASISMSILAGGKVLITAGNLTQPGYFTVAFLPVEQSAAGRACLAGHYYTTTRNSHSASKYQDVEEAYRRWGSTTVASAAIPEATRTLSGKIIKKADATALVQPAIGSLSLAVAAGKRLDDTDLTLLLGVAKALSPFIVRYVHTLIKDLETVFFQPVLAQCLCGCTCGKCEDADLDLPVMPEPDEHDETAWAWSDDADQLIAQEVAPLGGDSLPRLHRGVSSLPSSMCSAEDRDGIEPWDSGQLTEEILAEYASVLSSGLSADSGDEEVQQEVTATASEPASPRAARDQQTKPQQPWGIAAWQHSGRQLYTPTRLGSGAQASQSQATGTSVAAGTLHTANSGSSPALHSNAQNHYQQQPRAGLLASALSQQRSSSRSPFAEAAASPALKQGTDQRCQLGSFSSDQQQQQPRDLSCWQDQGAAGQSQQVHASQHRLRRRRQLQRAFPPAVRSHRMKRKSVDSYGTILRYSSSATASAFCEQLSHQQSSSGRSSTHRNSCDSISRPHSVAPSTINYAAIAQLPSQITAGEGAGHRKSSSSSNAMERLRRHMTAGTSATVPWLPGLLAGTTSSRSLPGSLNRDAATAFLFSHSLLQNSSTQHSSIQHSSTQHSSSNSASGTNRGSFESSRPDSSALSTINYAALGHFTLPASSPRHMPGACATSNAAAGPPALVVQGNHANGLPRESSTEGGGHTSDIDRFVSDTAYRHIHSRAGAGNAALKAAAAAAAVIKPGNRRRRAACSDGSPQGQPDSDSSLHATSASGPQVPSGGRAGHLPISSTNSGTLSEGPEPPSSPGGSVNSKLMPDATRSTIKTHPSQWSNTSSSPANSDDPDDVQPAVPAHTYCSDDMVFMSASSVLTVGSQDATKAGKMSSRRRTARQTWLLSFKDAQLEDGFCQWQAQQQAKVEQAFGLVCLSLLMCTAIMHPMTLAMEHAVLWAMGLLLLLPCGLQLLRRQLYGNVREGLLICVNLATAWLAMAAVLPRYLGSAPHLGLAWLLRIVAAEALAVQCLGNLVRPQVRFRVYMPLQLVLLSMAVYYAQSLCTACDSCLGSNCMVLMPLLMIVAGGVVPGAVIYGMEAHARQEFLHQPVVT